MGVFWGLLGGGALEAVEADRAEVEGHARDSLKNEGRGGLAATHPVGPKGGCRFFREYRFPPGPRAWQVVQGQ